MALPKLISVLTFTNVAPAGQATLAHGLNLGNGNDVKPDLLLRDNADFSIISATATQVTVQNDGAAPATLQLWCWHIHSVPREIGGGVANLTPQPFVPAVGGGGGGSGVDLENGGVPLAGGPFGTLNLIGATATDAGGGTADVTVTGSGGGDRTWYGTGIDGDLVVTTGNVEVLDGNKSYSNVTVEDGACLYLGGWYLRVANTLLVQGTGTVECSGTSPTNAVGGRGGNTGQGGQLRSGYTIPIYTNNPLFFSGGGGGTGGADSVGQDGTSTVSLKEMNARTGGNGGASTNAGGSGGTCTGSYTCFANPFVAIGFDEADISSGVTIEGGCGGGGGGAPGGGAEGGGGGGGGGTGVICARIIDCPDDALRSQGGDGGPGSGEGGGGGAGMGGVLLIVTEGPFDKAAKCDVTGGAGGAGAGEGGDGQAAGDGAVVAISPSLGPL